MALSLAACSSQAADKPKVPTGSISVASSNTPAKGTPARAAASSVSTKSVVSEAPAAIKDEAGFAQYAALLREEAQQRGYSKALIEDVFSSLSFHPRAVVADKGQPEFVETLDTYLPKRVNQARIDMARKMYREQDRKSVV